MLFHTSEFIFIFLPAAVALHFILARYSASAAIIATTVTSLAFYTRWRPPFVPLPLLSILANFWIARRIAGATDHLGDHEGSGARCLRARAEHVIVRSRAADAMPGQTGRTVPGPWPGFPDRLRSTDSE